MTNKDLAMDAHATTINSIPLKKVHARRLREIYRSAGWPCLDVVEIELLAAGLLERLSDPTGHERVRVTDLGIAYLAGAAQINRKAMDVHDGLVDRIVQTMLRNGRLVWTNLNLRAKVTLDGEEGGKWKYCKPDVFSIRNSSVQAYLEPVVHEIKVILAAEIVSYLLQPPSLFHLEGFIDLICNYFRGKGGDDPSKTDLAQADSIRKAFAKYREKKSAGQAVPANSIIVAMVASYEAACTAVLTGDPEKDWVSIRMVLDSGPCTRLKSIAIEVRNIRLLERGTQLRQELSQNWRDFGGYKDALAITQQAFVREHFSTQSKPEQGVIVMNMHKAKGKQFDEVIIFEGWPRYFKKEIVANPDRICVGMTARTPTVSLGRTCV